MTLAMPAEAETLTSVPPALTTDGAAQLARAHFGLACAEVRLLTAERDQNLLLRGEDGSAWVMKVANPSEARSITDFQTMALRHLERVAPDLPVSRICRATGVTRGELLSDRRNKEVVFARQAVFYWSQRLTKMSLPEIGRRMGGRDHTTVLHGSRVYPEKRAKMGRHLRKAR